MKTLTFGNEYHLVTDKGEVIYKTINHSEIVIAQTAINNYINIKKSKPKNGNSYNIILKYISDRQKEHFKSGDKMKSINYFYREDTTMVVSSRMVAIYQNHIERPDYMPETEYDGYRRLEYLFMEDEGNTVASIEPVIMDNAFYYKITTSQEINNKNVSYFEKQQFDFLLDVFGSIEEIYNNIKPAQYHGIFIFIKDNIKFIMCVSIKDSKIINRDDLSVLDEECLNEYGIINTCTIMPLSEASKRLIKTIKIEDVRKNLQAFFSFKKTKKYNIAYDKLIEQL